MLNADFFASKEANSLNIFLYNISGLHVPRVPAMFQLLHSKITIGGEIEYFDIGDF